MCHAKLSLQSARCSAAKYHLGRFGLVAAGHLRIRTAGARLAASGVTWARRGKNGVSV